MSHLSIIEFALNQFGGFLDTQWNLIQIFSLLIFRLLSRGRLVPMIQGVQKVPAPIPISTCSRHGEANLVLFANILSIILSDPGKTETMKTNFHVDILNEFREIGFDSVEEYQNVCQRRRLDFPEEQ
jgi:hypothetical protein